MVSLNKLLNSVPYSASATFCIVTSFTPNNAHKCALNGVVGLGELAIETMAKGKAR